MLGTSNISKEPNQYSSTNNSSVTKKPNFNLSRSEIATSAFLIGGSFAFGFAAAYSVDTQISTNDTTYAVLECMPTLTALMVSMGKKYNKQYILYNCYG